MNRLLTCFLWLFSGFVFTSNSVAAITNFKVLDSGGGGNYKAIVASESLLPDYVIYRPQDLNHARKTITRLPVMIFANGGCNDTSLPYERMLSEIASHGYIVIALGAMQYSLDDRTLNKSPNQAMVQAIDWLAEVSNRKTSPYYRVADLNNIAFAGHSCGGAQLLAMAAEPRVKTYLMFNSGIGDMTMSNADKNALMSLHGPTIYLVGGESDVATANAELDYQRIKHVPVAFANDLDGGHSGTFKQPLGGSFTSLALTWLDWQLKNKQSNAPIFLAGKLDDFDGWRVKAKHFEALK